MKSLHIYTFCCFSAAVCVEASAVMQLSGHVGGEVSIHCSGSRNADNSSEDFHLYLCKEVCSRENMVIQTTRKSLEVTRRGRYRMEVSRADGAFKVTITRLKEVDTGTYHCGQGKSLIVLYQEVNLIVLNNASTVPPGPPPSSTTLLIESQTLPPGSLSSATIPAHVTLSTAGEKTELQAAHKFTETTVVIIVSVSLALLVYAIIPLVFYAHCRIDPDAQNKNETPNAGAEEHVTSVRVADGP